MQQFEIFVIFTIYDRDWNTASGFRICDTNAPRNVERSRRPICRNAVINEVAVHKTQKVLNMTLAMQISFRTVEEGLLAKQMPTHPTQRRVT